MNSRIVSIVSSRVSGSLISISRLMKAFHCTRLIEFFADCVVGSVGEESGRGKIQEWGKLDPHRLRNYGVLLTNIHLQKDTCISQVGSKKNPSSLEIRSF